MPRIVISGWVAGVSGEREAEVVGEVMSGCG